MKLRLVLLPLLVVAAYLVLRRGESRDHAPDVAREHADLDARVSEAAYYRAERRGFAPAHERGIGFRRSESRMQ